jgi:uncharacterized membrane protein
MMARKDVLELQMSVDAALKYVVSMGVVVPPIASAQSAIFDARSNPPDGNA